MCVLWSSVCETELRPVWVRIPPQSLPDLICENLKKKTNTPALIRTVKSTQFLLQQLCQTDSPGLAVMPFLRTNDRRVPPAGVSSFK